ncbi:hypothetical protein [Methylobacterium sp. WSM2598]|uniref:hypothetical protein n=1 Tax=Methylobacterium sp. WSM2598 TaxID=398261 RepID=UPI0003712DAE|nr:hypothetical protein [Methylobacterium sp. WSM2598]
MPEGEDGEDWQARIAAPRDGEAEILDREALLHGLRILEPARRDRILRGGLERAG